LLLWAIPFRFRVANIDQIFKLQKKRIQLLQFFLLKLPNRFFFMYLSLFIWEVKFSSPLLSPFNLTNAWNSPKINNNGIY